MSKFNLYAHDDSVIHRPSFQEAAAAAQIASDRIFAVKLSLFFAVIFAVGYALLTA
jgi:hypothetical protein